MFDYLVLRVFNDSQFEKKVEQLFQPHFCGVVNNGFSVGGVMGRNYFEHIYYFRMNCSFCIFHNLQFQ